MQQGLELGRVSHQDQLQGLVFSNGLQGRRHGDFRATIAAHGIDRENYGGHQSISSGYESGYLKGVPTSHSLVASFDNLLATVEAVRRHVVTTMNFTGSLVNRQCRCTQGIVRTTHATL